MAAAQKVSALRIVERRAVVLIAGIGGICGHDFHAEFVSPLQGERQNALRNCRDRARRFVVSGDRIGIGDGVAVCVDGGDRLRAFDDDFGVGFR